MNRSRKQGNRGHVSSSRSLLLNHPHDKDNDNLDYWLEDIETLSQMNVTSLTIEINQWISNLIYGCLISYSSFTASYS